MMPTPCQPAERRTSAWSPETPIGAARCSFLLAALICLVVACGAPATGIDGGGTDAPVGDPGSSSEATPVDATEADAPGVEGLSLPLRVAGRYVVDANGARVRLVGVNWNGAHQEFLVPEGLDLQTPAAIAAKLRALGFNSVRLTYSDRLVRDEPVAPAERLAANPDLQGQSALVAFDAVVHALAAEGLLVILNNHTSDAQWCCNDDDANMLWYNERFSEADWIADWVKLARRYRDVPQVVAADLRNELRGPATWGSGDPAVDWPAAAERCGAALLAENPDLVILVEGIGYATNLAGAAQRPVALPADRLAYSAHNYGWSMPSKAPDYQGFRLLVDKSWGYLLQGDAAAPVWLGEFGLFHHEVGNPWWLWIGRYIAERDLDWSLWGIFAYGEGTWGLLDPVTLEPANRALWETLKVRLGPPGVPPPDAVPPAPEGFDATVVAWVAQPGGTLSMGADDLSTHAQPVHAVTVPAFQVTRSEITVAQYQACASAAACPAPRDPSPEPALPAQALPWEAASAFCAWAGGRLCTEAEWELAAGGGAGSLYPWGDAAPTCAHATWTGPGCSPWSPAPACAHPAGSTASGLCDLAGNVAEWVEDDWHASYDGAPTDGSAWIDAPRASRRVVKGGAFAYPFADGLRAAWREPLAPGDEGALYGARCCRTP